MAIEARLPAAKKYRCDVCGHVDFWGESWSRYSSILADEVCPDQVPHMCSEQCKEIANQKLSSGEWKLPKIKADGYLPKVTRPAKGYR